MATLAQLQQDLINAVATVRVKNDRAPMDFKFSNGKTYTVYSDGSGNAEDAGVNFRDLTDKFNAAEAALRPQSSSTPISQMAQPAPQQAPQPAQTTPVAQVAPQSASSGYQFPTLKQSIIDDQLNKLKTNELTSFNSDIRDQIYNAGWNQKSDAVQVLNGAAVYGLAKPINAGIMGSPMYQKPNGQAVTDADFLNAAKSAGIDPSSYYHKQNMGMGGTQNVLDRNALYNAINDKSKDLYSITNAIEGAARGDKALHATALYKADGNGNLVVQNNPTTGQPDAKYFSTVRYASDPGFLSDFGPLLGMAGLAFGIPMLSEAFGPGVIGAGLGGEAAATGALTAAEAAGASGLGLGAGAGLGTGTMAGTMLGTTGATLGTTAGIAGGLGSAGLLSDLGADAVSGLPMNQVQAYNPNAVNPGTTGTTSLLGSAAKALGLTGLSNTLNGGTGTLADTLGSAALTNLLGSGGQALSSYLSGQAQADAAKQAAANQMAMFNTINNQLAPQRGAGYQSLNQIRSMLPGQYTTYDESGKPIGTAQGTDYLTHQFNPQDLYAGLAPNYNFMLQQGQQANQRAANVGGGLIGGNALRGLEDYTQNYAQNAYQNAFGNYQNQRTGIYNTLANIAGIGQNATNTSAQAGQNAVTAQGQLGVGAAAANAAGLTGAANAVQGGLQNYQQNQLLQQILGQNQNVAINTNTATPGYFGSNPSDVTIA
jgi:hypothetical protein